MARGDLLINLVRASVSGDKTAVRSVVETIIAEEKNKQHTVLADRLTRAMQANGNGMNKLPPTPEGGHKGREFIAEITPRRELADMVLSGTCRTAVDQLIEEQQRSSLLRAHGLDPRHRLLLVGPPGNGKTSLAEAIAEALFAASISRDSRRKPCSPASPMPCSSARTSRPPTTARRTEILRATIRSSGYNAQSRFRDG